MSSHSALLVLTHIQAWEDPCGTLRHLQVSRNRCGKVKEIENWTVKQSIFSKIVQGIAKKLRSYEEFAVQKLKELGN